MYSSNPACHSMEKPSLPAPIPLSSLSEEEFIALLEAHFRWWHSGQQSALEALLAEAHIRRIALCYFDDEAKFTVTLPLRPGEVAQRKLKYDL